MSYILFHICNFINFQTFKWVIWKPFVKITRYLYVSLSRVIQSLKILSRYFWLFTQKRKQLKQYPRAPIHIQHLILKLLNITTFDQIYDNCCIWKLSSPYKFCYINQPEHTDKVPFGLCSLYLYNSEGDFIAFYRGNINQNGLREVKNCLYLFKNADYFIGHQEKNNYGAYYDKQNKYKYEGDWVYGRPHGVGKQISQKGTYSGYFKNGKKNGIGKFQFTKNEDYFYEGEFKDNEICGKGKLIKKNSKYEYDGQFFNGEKHGEGQQTFDQFSYKGYFLNGKKSGYGKLVCPTYEFQGEFLNGNPNGKGIMKKNGKTIEGIWEQGQLTSILHAQ